MAIKQAWTVLKNAFNDFIDDDAMVLAAALAYYGALSLAPLLVVLVAVAGLIGQDVSATIVQRAQEQMGPQAAQIVGTLLQHAQENRSAGIISMVIGLATAIFAATAAFAHLQYSLNRIWDVQTKPGKSVSAWIRRRVISLMMVGAIGILLLVSIFATAILSMLVPEGGAWTYLLNLGLSFAIYVVLMAVLLRLVPDVVIPWRCAWVGGAITAVLFTLGKYAIGEYLARGTATSAYGAAGSLLAMLLWLYYSAVILFFGAEITQAYTWVSGAGAEPEEVAQWEPGSLGDRLAHPAS